MLVWEEETKPSIPSKASAATPKHGGSVVSLVGNAA